MAIFICRIVNISRLAEKIEKMFKNVTFSQYLIGIWIFGGTQHYFGGTSGFRGTQVEKHLVKVIPLLMPLSDHNERHLWYLSLSFFFFNQEIIFPIEQCISTFLRLRNPKCPQNNWRNPKCPQKIFAELHPNFSKLTNSTQRYLT